MSLMLSGLLIVAVILVGAAGFWGYRTYRQRNATESLADRGDPVSPEAPSRPQAADGMAGLVDPDASSMAGGAEADPVADFELDPDAWAPLAHRGQRMARFRGAVRGAQQAARLVGEPDVLFEHRDGTIAVGLDAARRYEGYPAWREVSTLTLQMGVTKLRWPKAEVTGVIRYADCTVALPYKHALYSDLRRAARSHKGQSLPSAEELSGAGAHASDAHAGIAERPQGLLARLRSAIAARSAHLVPRRYHRQ